MKKTIVYRYLGANGVIETPVLLDDAYYVRVVVLTADEGKLLTKDGVYTTVVRIPEAEIEEWKEVEDKGQI